jgi:aerotaxis receptor
MNVNQALTQNEYIVRDGALIVSVTDINGKIVEVSPEFIQVSGFSAEELIGKDHGSMRHPDVPDAVYADLWNSLHSGRPWSGLMKNRRKNGDYFWDIANATPLREGGAISGYMTMRTKPTAQQIREADELYQKLRDGSEKGLSIVDGRAVRTNWRHSLNPLSRFSEQGRRWLDTAAGVTVLLFAAALLPCCWACDAQCGWPGCCWRPATAQRPTRTPFPSSTISPMVASRRASRPPARTEAGKSSVHC